jgi:hypothetical protein
MVPIARCAFGKRQGAGRLEGTTKATLDDSGYVVGYGGRLGALKGMRIRPADKTA